MKIYRIHFNRVVRSHPKSRGDSGQFSSLIFSSLTGPLATKIGTSFRLRPFVQIKQKPFTFRFRVNWKIGLNVKIVRSHPGWRGPYRGISAPALRPFFVSAPALRPILISAPALRLPSPLHAPTQFCLALQRSESFCQALQRSDVPFRSSLSNFHGRNCSRNRPIFGGMI